jgi:DNA repair protein RadC
MENFVNILLNLKNHIIQVKVRFGRTIQLIRYAPQMVFHLTEFFEDKSCDLTIQVNFFTFVIYLKKF